MYFFNFANNGPFPTALGLVLGREAAAFEKLRGLTPEEREILIANTREPADRAALIAAANSISPGGGDMFD